MLGERMFFVSKTNLRAVAAQKQQAPPLRAPTGDAEGWHKHPPAAAAALPRAPEPKLGVVTAWKSSNPPGAKGKKGFPVQLKEREEMHEGKDKAEQQFVWCEKNQRERHGLGTPCPKSKNWWVFPLKEWYGTAGGLLPSRSAAYKLSLDLIRSETLLWASVWASVWGEGSQRRNCPFRQWINSLSMSLPGGCEYADTFESVCLYISLLSKNILRSPLKELL